MWPRKSAGWTWALQEAFFVPATDDAEDTSYFEERGLEGIDGAHDEYPGSSNASGSPGGSSLTSRMRQKKGSVSRRRSLDGHVDAHSPHRPHRSRRGSRVHQHDHRHSLSAFGPNPNPNLASAHLGDTDWDAASIQGSECGTTTPGVSTPSAATRCNSLDLNEHQRQELAAALAGRRGGGGSEADGGNACFSDHCSGLSERGSAAGDSSQRQLDNPFATEEDLALEGSSGDGSSIVAESSSYNSCSTLSEELLQEAEGLAATGRHAHADDFMNFSFKNLEQLAHYNLERVDVLTAVEEHHSGTVTPNTPTSHHATPRGERSSPIPQQPQSQPPHTSASRAVAPPHRSLAEELEQGLSPRAAEAVRERALAPGTPHAEAAGEQQQRSTDRPQPAIARFSQ
jgi:hypothetical protein